MNGCLVDNDGQLAGLERSLGAIGMGMPMRKDAMVDIQQELIRRDNVREGIVYLEVTRGAPRHQERRPTCAGARQAGGGLDDSPFADGPDWVDNFNENDNGYGHREAGADAPEETDVTMMHFQQTFQTG